MFKCQRCGKQSQAHEKQHHKIVETRQKTYVNGEYNDKFSKGTEIVKELHVGDCCALKV